MSGRVEQSMRTWEKNMTRKPRAVVTVEITSASTSLRSIDSKVEMHMRTLGRHRGRIPNEYSSQIAWDGRGSG